MVVQRVGYELGYLVDVTRIVFVEVETGPHLTLVILKVWVGVIVFVTYAGVL